ncbi:MAG: bifunctional sulfate adenylyltransferase/adenylylsulfate kinase [Gammaproteobacteria bacterium]
MTDFVAAHGGALQDLYLQGEEREQAWREAQKLPSWNLSLRQMCDIELLLNGGFSPLTGFLNAAEYRRVLAEMRLTDGTLWPMPITLDVSAAFADQVKVGDCIALRDPEGIALALLAISDHWVADKTAEAHALFGSEDEAHPGVFYLRQQAGPVYLGGRLYGLEAPRHYDFPAYRHTPRGLRAYFHERGWRNVVALQTRNPLHRAHVELLLRAARQVAGEPLIHPVVGMTKPGDIDHYARVRCYRHVVAHQRDPALALSLLPLAMRMAGPREALWHAIIRQNFGCRYFIIGRDHAGPGKNRRGEDFYPPYAAQALVQVHQAELAIRMLPFQAMVYSPARRAYCTVDEIDPGEATLELSGTELRRKLEREEAIPDWFSYPEVIAELRELYPPKSRQGFTVFFTGLPAAGKSTLANALRVKLMESGQRKVTLLDGDHVRKHLSSELGYSTEHRNLNVTRIGYVAYEITRNGGIAICAPIAPYAASRRQVREMIEPVGGFIEVHVATTLEVCAARDPKGLYAKAKAGLLKGLTGVDDPYEIPAAPELRIDLGVTSVPAALAQVYTHLIKLGYLSVA